MSSLAIVVTVDSIQVVLPMSLESKVETKCILEILAYMDQNITTNPCHVMRSQQFPDKVCEIKKKSPLVLLFCKAFQTDFLLIIRSSQWIHFVFLTFIHCSNLLNIRIYLYVCKITCHISVLTNSANRESTGSR